MPLEIIIGTIPLRQAITHYPTPSAPSIQPFAGFAPEAAALYPPGEGAVAPSAPSAAVPSMPNLRK